MGKEKGIRGWYNIPPNAVKSNDPEFWEILKTPPNPAYKQSDLQVTVQKIDVKAHPRKLTATWTMAQTIDWNEIDESIKPVDGEPEFWTILRTPPKRKRSLAEEVGDELSKQIQIEIDKEIVEQLLKEATKTATKK